MVTAPDGRPRRYAPPRSTAAANLCVALSTPFLYVYDPSGEKIRTVRLQAAGAVRPSSLHFPDDTRPLVAPGCHEFTVWRARRRSARGGFSLVDRTCTITPPRRGGRTAPVTRPPRRLPGARYSGSASETSDPGSRPEPPAIGTTTYCRPSCT